MRKRALLIVGLALMIAAAGVVYAHWEDTLTVKANVTAGSIEVHWKTVGTDDDGELTADLDREPVTGSFQFNAPYTSNDPDAFGPLASRETKDVADCEAWIDTSGDRFRLEITEAYPSYHCTTWSYFANQGSVPVKLESINLVVTRGSVVLPLCPASYPCVGPSGGGIAVYAAAGVPEITWDTVEGTNCGYQADPNVLKKTVNNIHVEQAAPPGMTYSAEQTLTFRNWNESSYPVELPASQCTTFIAP